MSKSETKVEILHKNRLPEKCFKFNNLFLEKYIPLAYFKITVQVESFAAFASSTFSLGEKYIYFL